MSRWHPSPMLSSTAATDEDLELMLDFRRRPHPLAVPPPPTISSNTYPPVAISVPANNNLTSKRQDVRSLNSPSASFRPPSPAPRFNGFPNDSLDNNSRPRTTNFHIFPSTQDLAAHHGIPQTLPPPPRPVAASRGPSPSQPTDFNSMLNNYLTMRGQNNESPAGHVPPSALVSNDIESTMRALDNYMASPEFRSLGDSFEATSPLIDDDALFNYDSACGGDESPLFGDGEPYLTSPFEESLADFTSPLDTPFSDFLSTPAMPMLGDDFDADPLIIGGAEHGYDPSAPLFGDAGMIPDSPSPAPAPKLPNTANLWEISPGTPVLDAAVDPAPTVNAAANKTGPVIPPAPAPSPSLASLRRRTAGATGTRKNLTPEGLIPLDAPTQRRTYLTPSATSRKVLPAVFAKKRAHSTAFGSDADLADAAAELGQLSPTASEAETIEYKRRQNTLAARKSRKRKLLHQQELEESVAGLEREVTMWRERAMMGQEMLRSHGIMFSFEGTGGQQQKQQP